MAVKLPLFPLRAVLFPHMPMALHIFEERYRAMLRDCRAAGTTFGVVAIREGLEVGDSAIPYAVGTLADLDEIQDLPDGRANLVIFGASRFHIDSMSRNRGYLVAEVHYLEDAPAPPDGAIPLIGRVEAAYRMYLNRQQAADVEIPDDPELLSYFVAGTIDVGTAQRQELLEIDGALERLAACLRVLQRENTFVDRLLTNQSPKLEQAWRN